MDHTPACLPGKCRRCWRPCSAKVQGRGQRCPACLDALMEHPSPAIRRLVVDDPVVDAAVLRSLSMDPDIGVSMAAQSALAALEVHGVEMFETTAPQVASAGPVTGFDQTRELPGWD